MGLSDARLDASGRRCLRPLQEVLFTSIVAGLLTEGHIPNGSIVDVGANRGLWACYWASVAPHRLIFAIDPDPKYVRLIAANYARIPNLRPVLGALSSASAITDHAAAGRAGMRFFPLSREATDGRLRVYTLDELFDSWRGERLGFAQFDVDGFELPLLQGARRVIARDRPIFSTELHVHESAERSRALLRFTKQLGYSAYLIEEVAGNRADIRNILHVPHERTAQLRGSSVLDLAAQTRRLLAVDASTILDFAFPCCEKGGACCPYVHGSTPHCCAHFRVSQWMSGVLARGGADLQWGTRTTWYDQQYWLWGPQLARVQRQEMTRNLSTTGLSYNHAPSPKDYIDRDRELVVDTYAASTPNVPTPT